jgi:hypothetical protein
MSAPPSLHHRRTAGALLKLVVVLAAIAKNPATAPSAPDASNKASK